MRVLLLQPGCLPKVPFSNTIILGIRFQHMNSRGEDTSIQFIACMFKVFWSLESQYSVLPLSPILARSKLI